MTPKRKAFIIRSPFQLNPVFLDKRQVIEDCMSPFVRVEWTNETEGQLIAMQLDESYLYATEQRIATYVIRWFERIESIEEV